MKKRILLIIPTFILFIVVVALGLWLYGKPIGKTQSGKPQLKYIEIPEFPVVKNPLSPEDTPSQVPGGILTESSGEIAQYMIHDNQIYYIIAYDFGEYGWYQQISVFKQALDKPDVQKVMDYHSDRWIDITGISYEDNLKLIACDDSYNLWEYTMLDGTMEEAVYYESDRTVEDAVKDYDVDADALDGNTWVCGENEQYVVWELWPQIAENVDTSFGSTTNILNKKTGELNRIENDTYGSVHSPALYGNRIFFLTIDDIKSYASEKDSYENIYMIQLESGEESRLTTNYGAEDKIDTIFYDNPRLYDRGICFLSRLHQGVEGNTNTSNQYLYYMELN